MATQTMPSIRGYIYVYMATQTMPSIRGKNTFNKKEKHLLEKKETY